METFQDELISQEALKNVAREMMIAAQTAPKGRGIDNLVMALVEGEEIARISAKLKEMGERYEVPAFLRDAESILLAPLMLLLGTKVQALGLKKCGMCGFGNCEGKNQHPEVPCVFNSGDLGIAIGSAVSVAMDRRVDNRIMYTVGQAVMAMGFMGKDVRLLYGIPLSATAKNPFFDRK